MDKRKEIHKALRKWMGEYVTVVNFCKKTGISEPTARSWHQGIRTPSRYMAMKIEKLSKGKLKANDITLQPK